MSARADPRGGGRSAMVVPTATNNYGFDWDTFAGEMARRLIWVSEKTGGVYRKRPACSECGWLGEPRQIALKKPTTRKQSAREELDSHECAGSSEAAKQD